MILCSFKRNSPSVTPPVHVGGSLMEVYVLTCAARKHRRNMKKLIKKVQRDEEDITILESDTLVEPNRNGFYLHVLHTLHHRGSSVKLQMFYMSMLWRHKGVSRSGIQLMSHLDLGLPLRTLDEYREKETARQTEYTRCVYCRTVCYEPSRFGCHLQKCFVLFVQKAEGKTPH